MESREFLGTEPVRQMIWKLSLPIVASQIVNLLYNIVDRIYIGHIEGTGTMQLTALGLCMPIIMGVSAFPCLIGTGGGPKVSIFLAQKKNKDAEKIISESFTLLMIISAAVVVLLLPFSKAILQTLGASRSTLSYAETYMRYYLCGSPFVMINLGMTPFLTAQGFSNRSMRAVLTGAISNIVLDPLFIYILKMDVAGAAIATVLSQAVSAAYVLHFLAGNVTALKIRPHYLHIQLRVIMPCLKLGLASFIMQFTESILHACFNSSLYRYGGDPAIGAMTILSSVQQFINLPAFGFCQGIQPILSYNYGAGKDERVCETFLLMLKITVGFTVIVGLVSMLFPKLPVMFFASDAAFQEYASKMLRIYIAGMTIYGFQISIQMTFTSLDKANAAIAVALMRKIVLLIPFIYIFPRILPCLLNVDAATAVFMAEPVADVLSVLFSILLFISIFTRGHKEKNE